MARHSAEVVIAGAGIAGIVTALELLERGVRIVLLDRDVEERLGGLARESFGGLFFVDTPLQRRFGIRDSAELALADWTSYAEFEPADAWPRRWAEQYVNECTPEVYRWLKAAGIGFFPIVQWLERGMEVRGNSVPRFHLVWGTGRHLVDRLVARLRAHRHARRLEIRFGHHVTGFDPRPAGGWEVRGVEEASGTPFGVEAEQVVIASGGICGDLDRLRRHWCADWSEPPEVILNGSHRYADGELHDAAAALGAKLTHLDRQWSYAAGVHHPNPDGMRGKGLSLVPPKSALWLNSRGERMGPRPLVSGFDTRALVERICQEPRKYSWQIMNRKIAAKELAVSGAEFNDALRERRPLAFLRNVLFGNGELVRTLLERSPDLVSGGSLEELVERMNALAGTDEVSLEAVRDAVEQYDAAVEAGPPYRDEQLRQIARLREYRGDRARTCDRQKIVDQRAMPLIAIREHILSRKSLGGIQTDLEARVLTDRPGGDQEPIPGLYAVGEAAGFGGGGIHGKRALEGTFLGSCILSGRKAAAAIAGG